MLLITETGKNGTGEVSKLSDGTYMKRTSSLKPLVPTVTKKQATSSFNLFEFNATVRIDFTKTNCTKVRVEVLRDGQKLSVNFNNKKTTSFVVTGTNATFKVDGMIIRAINVKLTPIYCIDGHEIAGTPLKVNIR